ncbi:glucose-6-phosphate isomerase [Glaciimonas sp. GG7]
MTQWSEPRRFEVDVAAGVMRGTDTLYQKRLQDLAGLYADGAAFDALLSTQAQDVVYDVSDFRPNSNAGDLITGVTRMCAGKVGDEFFMTRGHVHAIVDRPELYYGLKGHGLMLMESPDGETRIIEIGPNTACYVAPHWIHRSVNIGSEDFVMLFCYPADSGQNYAIIERAQGMKLRIIDDGAGGWRSVDNPLYLARSSADVTALIDSTAVSQ